MQASPVSCIGLSVAVRLSANEVLEYEHPQGGREVGISALGPDGVDEVRQRQVSAPRNFLQPLPEAIFQTDAGLVAGDDD